MNFLRKYYVIMRKIEILDEHEQEVFDNSPDFTKN